MSGRTLSLLARLGPAAVAGYGRAAAVQTSSLGLLRAAAAALPGAASASASAAVAPLLVGGGVRVMAARSFSAAEEALSVPQQAREARKEQRFEALKELEAPELYTTLLEQFDSSGPPGNNALCLYLDKCTTAEDAVQAVELIRRYRAERVYHSMLQPLPEEVAVKLVDACVRGGAPHVALGLLARATEAGLMITDAVVAALAADRSKLEEAQVDAVVDAYNELKTLQMSADVESTAAVLLTLLKGSEVERAVAFSEALVAAGQTPMGAVWELIASAAKDAGLAERAAAVTAKMGSA